MNNFILISEFHPRALNTHVIASQSEAYLCAFPIVSCSQTKAATQQWLFWEANEQLVSNFSPQPKAVKKGWRTVRCGTELPVSCILSTLTCICKHKVLALRQHISPHTILRQNNKFLPTPLCKKQEISTKVYFASQSPCVVVESKLHFHCSWAYYCRLFNASLSASCLRSKTGFEFKRACLWKHASCKFLLSTVTNPCCWKANSLGEFVKKARWYKVALQR